MTQQHNNQQPPLDENVRIRERKRKVIDTLNEKFYQPVWRERLMKICGQDESRIMKALNSFISYIMADDGGKDDRKAYIADCTLASISTAFLEAFQMGIEVGGGRDHAYLVNYANQCELDISYKGFVYALNKHFDNAFVDARCVFEGDDFKSEITDMTATFTHKPLNPFEQTWEKLVGCYCYFSYTLRDGGGKVSRLIMIPRGKDAKSPDTLEMIRSKAKGSWAWKDFPFEQCKKATIRRGTKIPFASIDFGDEDVNPETVDNRHYQLEANSGDRLRLMMDKHKEMLEDEKPDEPKNPGKAAEGTPASQGAGTPVGNTPPAAAPGVGSPAGPADPAGASIPPVDVGQHPEDNGGGYEDIGDADFGDPSEGTGPVIDQPAMPMPDPQPLQGITIESPTVPVVWDGQTLIIGGKSQARDFATPAAAAIYLKKVISQRKHKASRLGIINENPLLFARLMQDNKLELMAEIKKLAEQGE